MGRARWKSSRGGGGRGGEGLPSLPGIRVWPRAGWTFGYLNKFVQPDSCQIDNFFCRVKLNLNLDFFFILQLKCNIHFSVLQMSKALLTILRQIPSCLVGAAGLIPYTYANVCIYCIVVSDTHHIGRNTTHLRWVFRTV
jgi:hypothetical protein